MTSASAIRSPLAFTRSCAAKATGCCSSIWGAPTGLISTASASHGTVKLEVGDLIRIGETEIEYASGDQGMLSGATVFLSGPAVAALPADTITSPISGRSTSDLLSSIQSGAISGEMRLPSGQRAVLAAESAGRDLLSIVSQVGIALLPRTTLEDTLRMTIDLVFQAIPAERGFLFLKEGDDLTCKIARGASRDALPTASQVQISRSITSRVLSEGASVLTSDAMHDPRFQSQNSVVLSQIRSVMAVPLFSGEETFGMIYVDNPFNNRFTEEDLKVLTTIASVASIKIEHERLLEERLEKRRMEEELKVASEIQMRLQPVAPPKIDRWDMTGVSFPCREIGGDYYDFIQRSRDNRLVVAVGDVSGKGTGAALLMSSLHAAVRAQSQTRSSISEVMTDINRYIYENSPPNKYLTLFYGELDPDTGALMYSNGGHNTPMLVRPFGRNCEPRQGRASDRVDAGRHLSRRRSRISAGRRAGHLQRRHNRIGQRQGRRVRRDAPDRSRATQSQPLRVRNPRPHRRGAFALRRHDRSRRRYDAYDNQAHGIERMKMAHDALSRAAISNP